MLLAHRVSVRGILAPLVISLALAAAGPVWAQAPPLPAQADVVKHLDDLYRSKSSIGTFTMEVKTKNYERTMTMEQWSIGQDEALIVIRKPEREAGTATLRTEQGLWNYAPRADRLIRIPSGLLSESWMGSHFTNDDLMRESSYDDDFDTTMSWVDEGGRRLLQLSMVPKPDAAVVFTKIVFLLTGEGWLPVRADYYDEGDVVRRMHFKDVKTYSGRKMPSVMEVIPEDKKGEFTRVRYDAMEFDVPVDRSLFTPRGVKRKAQQR